MKRTRISVSPNNTEQIDDADLIVSVRHCSNDHCDVVVGCPGLPNVIGTMRTGDIVLFESPNDGMFEVRLLTHNYTGAEFLISQISPRPGLVGGFVSDDPNNSPFSSDELARIAESVTQIRFKLDQLDTFLPEQIALVNRKLDEIEAAATRLGRKDWINYVVGVLTSISVSAAFTPEASKALFSSVGTAFEWLLNNAIIMLQ